MANKKDEITVTKIRIGYRDMLKEISAETGMSMIFIIGKLIDAKYKEVFGNAKS